ncbi:hypothetical protein [Streptomyces sp. SLBN-118]|nr:hypothetical protein [Streptomyces sp. SLBN-118]
MGARGCAEEKWRTAQAASRGRHRAGGIARAASRGRHRAGGIVRVNEKA